MKREFLVERNGRTFALYAGLLDEAHAQGLKGISTELVQVPTDANGQTAICRATVATERGTFTGLGDACPTNVSRPMLLHLIRLAETRAKARALRDAVNVGVAAVEELGPDGPVDEVADARPRPIRRTSAMTDAGGAVAPPPLPSAAWPAPAGRPPVTDADGGATERQYRLLRELAGRLEGRQVPDGLSRGEASALIDQWKAEGARP